ncbi:dimethylsulfonioproprionate lyase family protein [Roseivivax sp. CAU 1761]
MTQRDPVLQAAIDAAGTAFAARARGPEAQACVAAGFAALRAPEPAADRPGGRLPVCDRWLPDLLAPSRYPADLAPLVAALAALEPRLRWQRRNGPAQAASADFDTGHANALLTGPGGLEPRQDVWLGASLLAPGVRYPDHSHPPEEVYLVLAPGEFSQSGGAWFDPGPGGSFYNPPAILHAMRAGPEPLFALWLLRADGV